MVPHSNTNINIVIRTWYDDNYVYIPFADQYSQDIAFSTKQQLTIKTSGTQSHHGIVIIITSKLTIDFQKMHNCQWYNFRH